MKNKADEPQRAPKPRTKRRGEMRFLIFPGGMTEDDVNQMGQTVEYELARLTSLASGKHRPLAIQNAAGKVLANIVAQIVKHQNKGFQDPFVKIRKENDGFKKHWKELGNQGKKDFPHHPFLRTFIFDVEYVVAPPRIFSRVSESLLGSAMEAPPQDSILFDKEVYGPVDPNYLRRFERWAKLHLTDLDAIKAEFAKVDCTCKAPPSPNRPPCPQKQIRKRLIKELKNLPTMHFDSYWQKIIEPFAIRYFEKAKPLDDATLQSHADWPKSFAWRDHRDMMRKMLEAAWRK